MADLRYQRFVIGYHGCDASVAALALDGKAQLKPSDNRYDWLGGGIYFWEHGPQRAYEWAIEQAKRPGAKITLPTVLGAQIDLGICFDLLDTANTRLVRKRFANFRRFLRQNRIPMPQNRDAQGSRRGDKVLRFRDCAVIDFTLSRLLDNEGIKCQTVRGVFLEGGPAYPGSKIMLKSHIQIAVRDSHCITKLFQPQADEFQNAE